MIKGIVVVLLVSFSLVQVISGFGLMKSGEKSVNAYHSRIAKAVGE